MKRLLYFVFFFSPFQGFAQQTIDVNKEQDAPNRRLFYVVGGMPFAIAKYVNVTEGSPYFKDEWMKGVVIIASGEQCDNRLLRLDLVSGELHYLDSAGREMITTEKVAEVILKDTLFGKQYRFVNSFAIVVPGSEKSINGWYELLSQGTATLFCKYQKDIEQDLPYGSSTYNEIIKTTKLYFLVYNKAFYNIKKIKDVPDILSDKRTELINYINNKNLSGKSESDFSSLIDYYNSLHPR